MMITFDFFLYYSSMLLLGAILICGWYSITRGDWSIKPDGSFEWKGKIFSGWQRFWEETTDLKKIYYKGDELIKLVIGIEKVIPGIKGNYVIIDGGCSILLNDDGKRSYAKSKHHAELAYMSYKSLSKEDGSLLFFYQEEDVYRFPEWVRSPMASCIYCHGSIYGSIVWWATYFIFHAISLNLQFIFWVPYMISLSFVAPYLYKKI